MPGKKKSQKGVHLKAANGKRPERKYNADSDEDSRDDEFQPEDRAGESSGGSCEDDDDDMAVEMAVELQALAGGRQKRTVKQQKVAHPRHPLAAPAVRKGLKQASLISFIPGCFVASASTECNSPIATASERQV